MSRAISASLCVCLFVSLSTTLGNQNEKKWKKLDSFFPQIINSTQHLVEMSWSLVHYSWYLFACSIFCTLCCTFPGDVCGHKENRKSIAIVTLNIPDFVVITSVPAGQNKYVVVVEVESLILWDIPYLYFKMFVSIYEGIRWNICN